jgi:hypothetical protein
VRITATGRSGLGAGIVPRAVLGSKSAKLGAPGKHNSFEQRAGMPVPDERVAEVVRHRQRAAGPTMSTS